MTGSAIFLISIVLIYVVIQYEFNGDSSTSTSFFTWASGADALPNIPAVLDHSYLSNPNRVKKIAFISALFGTYEATIKEPETQSLSPGMEVDFFVFSDRPDLLSDESQLRDTQWKLVTTPYHDMLFKSEWQLQILLDGGWFGEYCIQQH